MFDSVDLDMDEFDNPVFGAVEAQHLLGGEVADDVGILSLFAGNGVALGRGKLDAV